MCWSPPRGAYEPGGRVCVAGGYSDGTVRIFSLESSEMELKLQPHLVAVCALQYSHYGECVRVCETSSVLCLIVCVFMFNVCACRSCGVVWWS